MNINIKCGICGSDITAHPSVTNSGYVEIIATCPGCREIDKQIGDLEDQIYELRKQKEAQQATCQE